MLLVSQPLALEGGAFSYLRKGFHELISHEYPLDTGSSIFYHGEDVRRERTGVHAKVTITLGRTLLAYTTFNIEKDEDRVRLANSAWQALGQIDAEAWPKGKMKHGLDLFCSGLWVASVGEIEIGLMEGVERVGGTPYLCRPFAVEGGGTIIYAPPGRGKSFSALLMAVSIDAGCPLLFHVERAAPTLYINIERDKFSMSDRLARINRCLGLEPNRPLHFMNQRGKSLNDIIGAAQRYVDRHHIEFVLLDSISRSGFGDLNDNQPVNRIIDAMNGLCRSWGALAHTPRADESHLYGSVHFDAGMDVGVKLSTQAANEGMTVGVALTVTKANDGRVGGAPLMYALEFDETGLRDVRDVRRGEFLQLEGGKSLSPEDQIKEFLSSYGRADGQEVSKNVGLPFTECSRILNHVPWALRIPEGRRVFWEYGG